MTTTSITNSGIQVFKDCNRKYYYSYELMIELIREAKVLPLFFGTKAHNFQEVWLKTRDREEAFKTLSQDMPVDETYVQLYEMMFGYIERYGKDDFETKEVEKQFECQIQNPKTHRFSRKFLVKGKVDAIINRNQEDYLMEHKTTSQMDGGYLDRLPVDFQILLYSLCLIKNGYRIVGVLYNILQKPRIKQGKATLETYQQRLRELYMSPEMFHREYLYFSALDYQTVSQELWNICQHISFCQRNNSWVRNTSQCFKWSSTCEYFELCSSRNPQLLIESRYQPKARHPELEEENAPAF